MSCELPTRGSVKVCEPTGVAAGTPQVVFGWQVAARGRLEPPQPVPDLARIFRSLYSLADAPSQGE